ncbi:VOC family protein [Nocardioides daphniae]|uniref:VOC family protein n=1 Tax=Nocardioides daphniae TaxID=402297 RepID=A0A4P7UAU6_9ACTN|nr:VOC family protein [Nocardioides daphniae]QCC77242.1 VOC family protein [Nocardioides daphniae]GGD26297.1 hypothetical protein GCM10007231_27150 [Nocardioides daphniae]
MTAIEFQVTFDAHDPGRQALFWAEALGYRLQPPPGDFTSWDDALDAWGVPPEARNSRSAIVPEEGESGPRVFFQQVPEEKSVKNRVHLDLRVAPGLSGDDRAAAHEEAAERLVAAGATVVRRVPPSQEMGDGSFIVMADPEGNEFCLD